MRDIAQLIDISPFAVLTRAIRIRLATARGHRFNIVLQFDVHDELNGPWAELQALEDLLGDELQSDLYVDGHLELRLDHIVQLFQLQSLRDLMRDVVGLLRHAEEQFTVGIAAATDHFLQPGGLMGDLEHLTEGFHIAESLNFTVIDFHLQVGTFLEEGVEVPVQGRLFLGVFPIVLLQHTTHLNNEFIAVSVITGAVADGVEHFTLITAVEFGDILGLFSLDVHRHLDEIAPFSPAANALVVKLLLMTGMFLEVFLELLARLHHLHLGGEASTRVGEHLLLQLLDHEVEVDFLGDCQLEAGVHQRVLQSTMGLESTRRAGTRAGRGARARARG